LSNSAHNHRSFANKGLEPPSLPFLNPAEHCQTALNFNQLLHTHHTRKKSSADPENQANRIINILRLDKALDRVCRPLFSK
jgi:hypothetical protein